MRSTAPRLGEAYRENTPFGAYNIDTAHKKDLESSCRDSRRFYSAVFDSAVPRFTRPWSSPVTDKFYDPVSLKDAAPSSLSRSVETTAQQYSIHRSRYKRFPDRPLCTDAPDVTYDTDCHLSRNKAALATEVAHSAIAYKNVGMSATGRDPPRFRSNEYKAALGPGSYDTTHPRSLSVSRCLDNRPLSSMASGVRRFGRPAEASRMLGQSWGPERANRDWGRGATISKAEYLRPQYLPKSYEVKKP